MTITNPSGIYLSEKGSPLEKLRDEKSAREASSALFKLRMVWGFRLCFDLIAVLVLIYVVMNPSEIDKRYEAFDFAFVLIFLSTEIIFILAFFNRKHWCKIPLNIFSAVSLLTFPVGTYLSIIHYYNILKVRFNT